MAQFAFWKVLWHCENRLREAMEVELSVYRLPKYPE